MKIKCRIISIIFVMLIFSCTADFDCRAIDGTSQIQVAAGERHTSALNIYGRVMSVGDNTYGQCNTWGWEDIKEIAAGRFFTAGLKSNGSVVITSETYDVSTWGNIDHIAAGENFIAGLKTDGSVMVTGTLSGIENVAGWQNIKEIAAGDNHLIGLNENGRCVAAGEGPQCQVTDPLYGWLNIKSIFAGPKTTVAVMSDGTPKIAGSFLNIDVINSWTNVKKYVPGNVYMIGLLQDGTVVTNAPDDSSTTAYTSVKGSSALDLDIGYYNSDYGEHIIAARDNGSVFATENFSGRTSVSNWDLTKEPLSIAENKNNVFALKGDIAALTEDSRLISANNSISGWTDIADVISGSNTATPIAAGLKHDGTVLLNTNDYPAVSQWEGIVKVAIGRDHIAGLRWNGTVVSTAAYDSNITWANVKDIAAGNGFTAALFEDGTVSYSPDTYNYFSESGSDRQKFVKDLWTDISKISAGNQHLVGLKRNGELIATGYNQDSRCAVLNFTDVTDIDCGTYGTLALKADGTVLYAGSNYYGAHDVSRWKNVVKIAAGDLYSLSLLKDGTVQMATKSASLASVKNEIASWNVSLKKAIRITGIEIDNGVTVISCKVSGDTNAAVYSGNILVDMIKTEEAGDPFYLTDQSFTFSSDYIPDKIKLMSWDTGLKPKDKATTYIYDGVWSLK